MSRAGGDNSEQSYARVQGLIDQFILDAWTSLSFKRAMGDRTVGGVSWMEPGWVGQKNWRRLMAYKIRHAYYENAGRHFMATADVKKKTQHREYGDAAIIVETVRASLLGDRQEIIVPGADQYDEQKHEQLQQPLPDAL